MRAYKPDRNKRGGKKIKPKPKQNDDVTYTSEIGHLNLSNLRHFALGYRDWRTHLFSKAVRKQHGQCSTHQDQKCQTSHHNTDNGSAGQHTILCTRFDRPWGGLS